MTNNTVPSSNATDDQEDFLVVTGEQDPGTPVSGRRLNRVISVTKRLTREPKENEKSVGIYTIVPGTTPPEKGDFRFWVRPEIANYLN